MTKLSMAALSKKILALETERVKITSDIKQRKRHLSQLQISKESLSAFYSEAEKIADLADLLEDIEYDLDVCCDEFFNNPDSQSDKQEIELELKAPAACTDGNRYVQLSEECERLTKELSEYKKAFEEYNRIYQRAKIIIQIKESELKCLKNELEHTFPF